MKKSEKVIQQKISKAIKDGVSEIVIREGKAPELREEKIISIEGTITAPGLFWVNKHITHKKYESDKCNIVYSKDRLNIILTINEEDFFAKTIIGTLHENAELKEFQINENKMWSIKELSDFLKARKFYFKDRTEATRIIANLQKFNATITTELQKEDNRKGDTVDMVATRVKSNIDLGFTLSMPIFKGEKSEEFKVQVEINVVGGGITVFLVSEDLYIINLESIEKIFERELECFTEAQIVCIEK